MDINISGIGIMLASTAGLGSVQSELTTTIRTSRCDTPTVGSAHETDTHQPGETYNNRSNSQDKATNSSAAEFSHVLREETAPRASTDNIAEMKRLQKHWQHDGEIEAKAQFPLPVDIPTLNLPASVTAQELVKAAVALRTGNHTIINNYRLQIAEAKNAGRGPASLAPEQGSPKFQVQSSKLTGPTTRDQGASVGVNVTAAPANGKRPLIDSFLRLAHGKSLDTNHETAASPKKSQLAVEKTAEHKSADNQGLGKLVASERQNGNASVDGPSRALKAIQPEICHSQTKNYSSSDSNTRSAVDLGAAASKPQALAMAGHYINTTPSGAQPALEAATNVTTSITQQITVSVEGSLRQGDTQLTIFLDPPELGRVFVRFQQQQDQITILLEVSKPETRCEIELALPQIMRALQDCGVQVRRVEVSAPGGSDELEQQAGKELAPGGQDKDEMAHYHSTSQGDHDKQLGPVHEWLTSTVENRYQSDFTPQIFVTNGSINMLI